MRLAHDRVTEISVGHLPCKFVLLVCHHGSPISLSRVEAFGVSHGALSRRFGQPALAPLLFELPTAILYGQLTRETVGRLAEARQRRRDHMGGDENDPPEAGSRQRAQARGGINPQRGSRQGSLRYNEDMVTDREVLRPDLARCLR